MFLLGFPVCLSGIAWLNYTGFCFEQGRYLPDEEFINPIVEEIVTGLAKRNRLGEFMWVSKGQKNPIPYSDIAEFHALNPDCCEIVQQQITSEGSIPIFLEHKIGGDARGFVHVKYLVRWRDDVGQIHNSTEERRFLRTNCNEYARFKPYY